jgi:hypothetical protein
MLKTMTRTRKTEIQTALSTLSPISQFRNVFPSSYRNLIAFETATNCSPARTAYANLLQGGQQVLGLRQTENPWNLGTFPTSKSNRQQSRRRGSQTDGGTP